jgi:exosortase
MSAHTSLSEQKNYFPLAVALGTVVFVFGYLYFVFGYSTGYMFERSTLWSNMRQGYRREGGEWGFGPFVVPAILVLLWVTRDRYRGLTPKPSWLGLFVLAFACFIYFGGYKANEKYVGYAAGQIFVAGFVLWFLGLEYFKRGFWLWVLFGLTWPMIFLVDPVSWPLRKFMTVSTYGFLKLIGEDVVRDGTTLMSAPTTDKAAGAKFTLGIADACSGLRSLFALGMVSLLYGYLALKKGWHRFFLFVAAVPFAVFGNFIRMLLLYFGTLAFGKEFAIGPSEHEPSGYHIGAGIMVFIVALMCMMVLVQVLNGGLKTLRRKKVRSRQISSSDEDTSARETA